MKTKHTPVRTCVACRETDEKRDLMRIVRQPDGNVCHDARGKISGRGAYLCAKVECITLAKKRKQLERALKVAAVPETLFDALMRLAEAETDAPPKPNTHLQTREGEG